MARLGLKPKGNPHLHVSLAPWCWARPRGFWRGNIGFHGRNKFRSLWFSHAVNPRTVVSGWGPPWGEPQRLEDGDSHTCCTAIINSTPGNTATTVNNRNVHYGRSHIRLQHKSMPIESEHDRPNQQVSEWISWNLLGTCKGLLSQKHRKPKLIIAP